jgi:PAS domain S-box-containing protein
LLAVPGATAETKGSVGDGRTSEPARRKAFGRVLLRYAFAAAMVLIALGVRMLLEPVTGTGAAFVLFFGAVVVTAVWAGPGPGLFATFLSLPLGATVFIMRAGYTEPQAVSQAALFTVDCVVVVYLSSLLIRARRSAERSAAWQRAFIDLAPDAFFLADLEGRFTDVNQAACRLLGYRRDELIGKTIADVLPPDELPRLAAVRAALLVPGQSERSEWRHVRKDGAIIPVEVSTNMLPGGRWQAFVHDISNRKRIEDEQRLLAEAGSLLARSLDYEQTLANLGQLMVRRLADWCVIDVIEDDNRPRRLKVVASHADREALSVRLEQLQIDRRLPHLAKSVLETGEPFLIEHITPADLDSFAQSEEHLRILRGIDPRSIMGVPLRTRGQLIGVLVLMSTDPARAYGPADLRAAEALAERAALAIENGRLYQTALRATQFRDEVLGVVAHDLRNPVAAIMMQASLLKRRGPAPERRNPKPVESILRASRRMNRLIGDLLDVTLIEAGRLSVERARVSARPLVQDSVETQRPMASAAALEMRVEIGDALPDVWGDQHRILQVLENLLGNAIKFTPPHGRVTIGAAPADGKVLFWVADTGCGISAEGLLHVFDRFWREKKTARHGAGLGLPIARGIIDAHGGRIWVESTPGRGTIVFFTVPEAPAAAEHRADTLH